MVRLTAVIVIFTIVKKLTVSIVKLTSVIGKVTAVINTGTFAADRLILTTVIVRCQTCVIRVEEAVVCFYSRSHPSTQSVIVTLTSF